MGKRYGKVIIDNRASTLDRPFTYVIDEEFLDIQVGMRVVVPFGRGNKAIKGILIDIEDTYDGSYRLKSIIDVLDDKPIVTDKLLTLSMWMRKQYIASYLDSLQPILPPGDYKNVNSFVELKDSNFNCTDIEEEKIIRFLKDKGLVLLADLKKELKIPHINRYLNNLEDMGIIETTIDIRTSITEKKENWVRLKRESFNSSEMKDKIGNRAYRQIEILNYLYDRDEIPVSKVLEDLNTSLSTVRALEDKGVAIIFQREVSRQPVKRHIPKYEKHLLNTEQRKVFTSIIGPWKESKKGDRFLIHGVTGSGKTEIYLQLVEEMLKENRDSIILVPEISLTPQTIDRFVGRFGDNVAILHSRLSQGERFDQWRMIKEGKVKIAVGARSAIFAPFKHLGLIVIDEEHESTYKSSQNPKYDTIEVASKRGELEDALLVLGTATPSIETYYKSRAGEINLLELKHRVNRQEMPDIQLIDMRKELKAGNKSIFSIRLYEEMKNTLEKGKQIILFLNRRGFSTFISCRECGYVVKCHNCDISMTYYRNIGKVRCHYCGETQDIPKVCPVCKSRYIKYFGIGTEQVEDIAKRLFPNARIARMDADTTTTKGSHEYILEDMKEKKIDILIGTQMISKGLDFENVTLVGIIAADTALNIPDYRSPEKTFQLITQVSGRAGRGDYSGKVILQTYSPEHYSIYHSKYQDYKGFYNKEIMLRKEFLYPPFVSLFNILIYGEDRFKVGKLSQRIYNIIYKEIYNIYENRSKDYIIGPYPAPLEKIKNNYRYQIILKSESRYLNSLRTLIYRVCISNEYNLDMKDVKLSIDINPTTIL